MSKYTIKDVVNTCLSEGTAYAVQHYLSPEKIENQELAKLCRDASEALGRIESFFVKHLGEDWEEQC